MGVGSVREKRRWGKKETKKKGKELGTTLSQLKQENLFTIKILFSKSGNVQSVMLFQNLQFFHLFIIFNLIHKINPFKMREREREREREIGGVSRKK